MRSHRKTVRHDPYDILMPMLVVITTAASAGGMYGLLLAEIFESIALRIGLGVGGAMVISVFAVAVYFRWIRHKAGGNSD